MGKVKYSYCLNENNELVHISSVTVENRHSHTFHCLECGNELIAKIGKIKVPHFAHGADITCNAESYLHKLAKRRICEKFISADIFPIIFERSVPCMESERCLFFDEYSCIEHEVKIESDLKKWKGNVVYDTCQEEVRVGEFQPDLLLTGPMDDKLGPVFIEIYKTHESEEPKVTSDYKIIETKKIKTESDIDNIIEIGFVEGLNCQTYNFSPKLPSIKKGDIPITRFILFCNGAAKVIGASQNIINCEHLDKRLSSQSVCELNIKTSGIDIWGNGTLDSYQTGLVYLIKKGFDIKNCILCKFYRYNEWLNTHICILYRSLGEQCHFPKQINARECPKYEKDPNLMNHDLSELEKVVTEVLMLF